MLPDRERLGQRSGARIQPLGHRQKHRLLQHHQLPIAAGQRRGKPDDLQAGGSHRIGQRTHGATNSQRAFGLGAIVDDLGSELVTEHVWISRVDNAGRSAGRVELCHLLGCFQRVQIGATDAAHDGVHQHLT